ncbi:MAG TPA: DNA alkylation repair protein [Rhizobiales bacterium]|nr:DNA alkylation repair protein [Hyphomicrobiales bacterium]
MSGLGRDATADDILAHLASLASDTDRAGMARYGIRTDRAYGVSNAVLRPLARAIGRDHERARTLWASGWREARLLASFSDDPRLVTEAQALSWADDFDSWEIVDHAADLFADSPGADRLVETFAADEREFVRRAAFAMMAWASVHRKKVPDEHFLVWLPLIEQHATDARNYVRKAVNWALRQIGKRSPALHESALALARKLAASPDRTARWIGTDAVRELTDEKTLKRLHRRRPAHGG